MKEYMKIGEYCEYKKRVVRCVECKDDDPCADCCLSTDIACLAMHCTAESRPDRTTVHFKMLGYRRKKYKNESKDN